MTNEIIKVKRVIFTHFTSIFRLYSSWKHQETRGFLTFSGGIGMELWGEMGYCSSKEARVMSKIFSKGNTEENASIHTRG